MSIEVTGKAFRLKRGLVNGLAAWFNMVQLSGKDSRERTRFVAMLAEELRNIEQGRQEILGRYVEKETEEGGKEVWKKAVDNGVEHFVIPDEKIADFQKEVQELYSEDFVIDVTEANRDKMKVLRDILLGTDYKFGPSEEDSAEEKLRKIRESNDYEEWCKAFETLDLDA